MLQEAGELLSRQRETLLYFVMLRQLETSSSELRAAFQRLGDLAGNAVGWDPRTVILDWLEGELRTLRHAGQHQDGRGSQLMSAAVALANVLKQ